MGFHFLRQRSRFGWAIAQEALRSKEALKALGAIASNATAPPDLNSAFADGVLGAALAWTATHKDDRCPHSMPRKIRT
jgi:hypothetical protein